MNVFRKLTIFILVMLPVAGFSQYYDLGQSPASIKWRSITTKHSKIIFPEYYFGGASRIMQALDTVRGQINYGFRFGPMRMPVVLHTQNFLSNGLVLLAPKRMEFIVNPLGAESATPWFKQLSVHEYRHSVQFSNTNRHFIKGLSFLLGQQGSLVGGVILPNWLMEGDAVLAETQMTSFGRGLQPSFTIDYRAMMGERLERYAIDKYFCGSYKDYIPDHYHIGYQIASFADTRYGVNIWDKVADFGSRYPFLILTTKLSLNKNYKTSVNKLFRATMDDLSAYWASLPVEHNSANIIKTPVTSYTTYSSPVQINDSLIVAFKSDMDRTNRLVAINPLSGTEKRLKYTGTISSQPIYHNGSLYWSEYRNSKIWEQRTFSVLRRYDIASGESRDLDLSQRALYPVLMTNNKVAFVEYEDRGTYNIVAHKRKWELPDSISVHGLAFDSIGRKLYFLGLSEQGMWIGRCNNDFTFSVMTTPSYSTLSRLKASGGKLYFNSIESGKDEVYLYDIASGKQFRISTSRYGSFDVMPSVDGQSFTMTTYADSKQGYLLSQQPVCEDSLIEVNYSALPSNRINPPRRKWDVMNIDHVRIDTLEQDQVKTRKYRKTSHLFSVHSWAPMGYDPSGMISENNFRIYAGATVMSQNVLASMVSQLSYAWTPNGSQVAGNLKYLGLAPKFELEAVWGGAYQYISAGALPAGNYVLPPIGHRKKNFEIKGRVYLPLMLSSGYNLRYLTPSIEMYHDNTLLLREDLSGYHRNGIQRLTTSLYYVENVRMAYRDFLPRLGYAINTSYTFNPARNDFGNVWSAYVRGYLPGVAPHHSLMLRSAVQYQNKDYYNFRRKELFPRGADYYVAAHKYIAFSADYQFPICYPDVGITSILHFKRIRMNLTGDLARYKDVYRNLHSVWSYGGEMIFDIAPLRLPPSTSTSIKISIFKPSDRKGVVVEAGLSLPI